MLYNVPLEGGTLLHPQDEVLLAYQIGFDLFENEMQSFSQQVCLSDTYYHCYRP